MSFPDNTKEKKVGDKANPYVPIKCILVSHRNIVIFISSILKGKLNDIFPNFTSNKLYDLGQVI